jgi:hypothetical protein
MSSNRKNSGMGRLFGTFLYDLFLIIFFPLAIIVAFFGGLMKANK